MVFIKLSFGNRVQLYEITILPDGSIECGEVKWLYASYMVEVDVIVM